MWTPYFISISCALQWFDTVRTEMALRYSFLKQLHSFCSTTCWHR